MEWISINDDLPEPSTKEKLNKVFGYSPSTIGITTAYYWGKTSDQDPCKGWDIMGVTHWLPLNCLPEPPKP